MDTSSEIFSLIKTINGAAKSLSVYNIPWLMRFLNTDSSTIFEPLHVVSSAIVGGWRSVGNPGNGPVLISKPCMWSPTFAGIAETWAANQYHASS